MSTTTQILFNSPALHSLKRDQLVKLCKIHSIKANGKNVELIQRLRQHAQSMPKDSPLSIAARSEPTGPIPLQAPNSAGEEEEMDDPASHRSRMARPSEQWEVVMDSIQEVEEGSSQGTLSSQRTINNPISGEFGTGSSRCTSFFILWVLSLLLMNSSNNCKLVHQSLCHFSRPQTRLKQPINRFFQSQRRSAPAFHSRRAHTKVDSLLCSPRNHLHASDGPLYPRLEPYVPRQ